MWRIPQHLTRQVKKQLGMSVVQWVQKLRAEHARNVLIMGSSPKEAAATIGMHSAQQFNKLFRTVYGELR